VTDYYVPGLGEKDPDKVIRSLMQVHENTATNTSDIADRIVGPASATDNAAARFDSATGKLIQNSALIIADTTGALSRNGNGGIPVQATNTNDNAASDQVGYFLEHAPGATSLTTATPANVAQLTLDPGNWIIFLGGFFSGAGTTTTTNVRLGINTTSATLPVGNPPLQFFEFRSTTALTDFIYGPSVGPFRVSIASQTTYYGVAQAAFSVSTYSCNGKMVAWRVR
jgi:hypothetical protein